MKLPRLFDFYAALFLDIKTHGDTLSGEDYDKIKHFILNEIKLAQNGSEFHRFLERDLLPYFRALPADTERLLNSPLFLSALNQKFSFLAEILETQVLIYRSQGSIALAKGYVEDLNSQAVAQSLSHLMRNRSETNSSTFIRNKELRPYFLKLVVFKSNKNLPMNFSIPG